MAKVTALKCPNCGSLISVGQNKCEYCGAGLIISPDSSFYSFRSQSQCPNCGTTNEASSWFCINCRTILTKNTDMLKRLQKKIKFELERAKTKFMPLWMQEKLEPDEFIYFVFKLSGNDFYAVTDKRIIRNVGGYIESPLSEAVSLGPPTPKIGVFSSSVFFEVHTFHGTLVFEFSSLDAQNCGTLYAWINTAIENYNLGKKDVRVVILSLDLGCDFSEIETLARSAQSEIGGTPKAFMKKCAQCGKQIPIASEECPYCGTKQT